MPFEWYRTDCLDHLEGIKKRRSAGNNTVVGFFRSMGTDIVGVVVSLDRMLSIAEILLAVR